MHKVNLHFHTYMIQRIQTVYLALAIAALVTLFFLPLANFIKESPLTDEGSVPTQQFELRLMGKYLVEGSGDPIVYERYIAEPLLAAILALLLGFIIIQYKNRALQITAGRFALIASTAFLVLMATTLSKELNAEGSINKGYQLGIYIPIIVIVLIFMSLRAIRKDEALVRAADRIR